MDVKGRSRAIPTTGWQKAGSLTLAAQAAVAVTQFPHDGRATPSMPGLEGMPRSTYGNKVMFPTKIEKLLS